MITMHLVGGLGNQMFMYYRGRTLSEQGYDVRLFDYCTQYGCQLKQINIRLPFTTKPEGRWIAERSLRYDPKPEVEDPAILAGYYQCDKYFSHMADTLRSEFTLREAPSPVAQQFANQIIGTPNSVAVHVRRGDYCTWAAERHGTLPLKYYQQAADQFDKPHLFIFSDDSTYDLSLPYPMTRVNCTPHEDLWLMSLCSNAIIANSSLSWHGAWLGADKRGKVIAPKQWFRTGNEDARDIVPERWLRI